MHPDLGGDAARGRPDRPVVLLCDGPRCRDRHRAGAGTTVERWWSATRGVRGAVLVRTNCLKRCGHDDARACAVIGWRHGEEEMVGLPLTFAGVDDPGTTTALTDWVTTHAATPHGSPFDTLPLRLRAHLVR